MPTYFCTSTNGRLTRELGEDMRKVIATKDAAHTREKCRW